MQELRVVPPVLAPTTRESRGPTADRVLEAVFDASGDAIVAVDAELRLVSLNPAAVAMFGARGVGTRGRACHEVLGCAERGEEARRRGSPLRAMGTGRAISCPRCPFREAMARRTRVTRRLLATDDDGRPIDLAGTFAPVPGPGGGAVGVLRLSPPVVGRELDEPESEVERSLAHQVRSTLALISGYSQTLLHLSLDEDTRRRCLRQMTVAADWLAEIAEEILARPVADGNPAPGTPAVGLAEPERIAE